jgi:formate hydrogenlyase subunit 3/multisubunit Na+/H+ antiporter MnhD subunit
MALVILAVAILIGSAIVALALFPAPRLSTAIGAMGAVAASGIGMFPAVDALRHGALVDVTHIWPVPAGTLVAGLDPLSAFFLIPLLGLSAVAAIYGRQYLLAYAARKSLGPPTFFFNLLVASMIVVVVARDGLLFLFAWEVMTLTSYALVVFDYEDPAVQRAGWVYLIVAHIGVACLFAMFLLLGRAAGSLEFASFALPTAPVLVFFLALVGFGIKAGVVPLHVWLPEAHAAAPSHVSALMSGVLIKMGLYGLLRVMTFLPFSGWWGPTLMWLGLAGALVGISLALYQRDLKRVLAYSSIENVGLILLGVGVGLWGVAHGHPRLAALGFAGGLLHVWNHVLMKGLMFLSAGSVLHGAGTKDLERLGGLMKRMPATGALMVLGATAIAGLPPLNGFVGEWLMYLGLIEGGVQADRAHNISMLLAVGLVALIGGLAVLCFVRLVGVVLLGSPRGDAAAHAHESSRWMTGPMALLALASLAVAVMPDRVVRMLSPVVIQLGGANTAEALSEVAGSSRVMGTCALAVFVALALVGSILALLTRRRAAGQTWGCGYAAPTVRMQYTGRSFSEFLAERLVPPGLRARIVQKAPEAIFPREGELSADNTDPFTRSIYQPFLARWADRFARLRWLQQGVLHIYILYILVVLVVGLGWMSFRAWMGA